MAIMPGNPPDGDREPQRQVPTSDGSKGGREVSMSSMAVWTTLLVGVLGGMTMIIASLTLPNERDGGVGAQAPRNHGKISSSHDVSHVSHVSHVSSRDNDNGVTWVTITERHPAVMPRILTVLTTYEKRSAFMKGYKEAVLDREDGYQPEIFVVSNLDDEDPYDVIDFKVGSSRQHRSAAAIAEATLRYAGTFDWIALGDDDTAFMYNRAMDFLSHMDHTKPVIFGRVDGLNSTGQPAGLAPCFSQEAKRTPMNRLVANGCCQDFANPCEVPVFPSDIRLNGTYTLQDYGPNGLYWAFGGSGMFMSAGLAVDVVGAEGWALCARIFAKMNTDIQIAQCLKMHGYSFGAYRQGFGHIGTPTTVDIRQHLASKCEVFGVHLGINRQPGSRPYTPETFGAAVAAVRDADTLSAQDGEDSTSYCHNSWTSSP